LLILRNVDLSIERVGFFSNQYQKNRKGKKSVEVTDFFPILKFWGSSFFFFLIFREIVFSSLKFFRETVFHLTLVMKFFLEI